LYFFWPSILLLDETRELTTHSAKIMRSGYSVFSPSSRPITGHVLRSAAVSIGGVTMPPQRLSRPLPAGCGTGAPHSNLLLPYLYTGKRIKTHRRTYREARGQVNHRERETVSDSLASERVITSKREEERWLREYEIRHNLYNF